MKAIAMTIHIANNRCVLISITYLNTFLNGVVFLTYLFSDICFVFEKRLVWIHTVFFARENQVDKLLLIF